MLMRGLMEVEIPKILRSKFRYSAESQLQAMRLDTERRPRLESQHPES